MTNRVREIKRYSISFKQKVVKEIEDEGISYEQARRRYGITGGNTIQQWLKKFGRNNLLNKIVRIETMEERDRIKALEAENKKLKLAYADAVMHRDFLETLVRLADDHFGIEIKKNFGAGASVKPGKKKGMK